jgi:integrase
VARITKRFIDRLTTTAADVVHWDGDMPGFGVRAKPSGARSYIVQYRNAGGQSKRLTLGRVGVLTPEEARREARKALATVAKGGDPAADRRAKRADLTVAQLIDRYLSEGPAAKPNKKKLSWASDAGNLRRHVVPVLGRRRLDTLTKGDIQRFQRSVTEGETKATAPAAQKRGHVRVRGGIAAAARSTAVLAAMLAWATERGLLSANPAKGVQLNTLAARERFLTDQELARLGDALVAMEARGVNRSSLNIVRLLLLTGARLNEIASLKWEYVDFQRGVFMLPDSKTGAKTVPVGAPVFEILAKLPKTEEEAVWVFPAARGDGHHQGAPKIWRRVRQEAGLVGVRLHDLRHTHASAGVALNQSLYIVGKILGHRRASTTQKYSHLALDPIRAAAEQTSRRLAGALQGGDGATVIRLKGTR